MRDIGRTIKMLSKMTVSNGGTGAEAEAASKKLLDLAARRTKEAEQRKKEREERRLRRARELGSAVRVFAKRVADSLGPSASGPFSGIPYRPPSRRCTSTTARRRAARLPHF
jgi:hypothetical protein